MRDSFYYIRQVASTLIAEYESRIGQPVFTEESALHKRLAEMIEEVYDFEVGPDYSLPDGAMGRLDIPNRIVGYAPDLSDTDRFFTLAHEAGHRALKHKDDVYLELPSNIDQTPDHASLGVQDGIYRGYSAKSRQELEANVFAAELLAPVRLVRERIQQDGWTVESLGSYFGLSKSAMLNQITAAMLPLPDEEDLPLKPEQTQIEDKSHENAIKVPTPALVQAGPGSGKTRVLVSRYERLIHEGAKPNEILALTFANKAAAEMRERLAHKLPDIAEEIVVTTFHSFGLDLVRKYWKQLGTFEREPRLASTADVLDLLKKNLAKLPLGEFEDFSAPANRLGLLLDAVSRAKDEMLSPEEFAIKCDENNKWALQLPVPAKGVKEIEKVQKEQEHAVKCLDAARFYGAYETLLIRECLMDYGDLIMLATRIVENSEATEEICGDVRFILVDEFQDVNHASGRLVRALDNKRGVVWAVGDVKQSIYRFRGASPSNLLDFNSDYPGANFAFLGNNYRSVKDVVECGALVDIKDPTTGESFPHVEIEAVRGRPEGRAAVCVILEKDRPSELTAIKDLVRRERDGGTREADIAVLCRSRADAKRVSDALEAEGLATSWAGDPLDSEEFKDILSMVALAAGDVRGLVRVGALTEHAIDAEDLKRMAAWRRGEQVGTLAMLRAAKSGEIDGLSAEGSRSCETLLAICGRMTASPTAYSAVSTYLFECSSWCRQLIKEDSPKSRRALGAVRQMLMIARAFSTLPAEDDGSAVKGFLAFLETAIESDRLDRIAPDLGDPRLVNVMTVHASKGLEWPVVLVPFLTDGKFPTRNSGERTPYPPNLSKETQKEKENEKAEEDCLFFVAVTRARDRLFLTRASYGGSFKSKSPYVMQIVEGLSGTPYMELTEVQIPEAEKPLVVPQAFDSAKVFDFTELSDYSRCPKRFQYERILGLSGGDKGYLRYHRVVVDTAAWIRETASDSKFPNEAEVCEELARRWQEDGPVGHFYEERYRTHATAATLDYLRRARNNTMLETDKELVVDADGRQIRIKVDEFESGATKVFRRVHLTLPRKSHLGKDEDDHHALFAMYGAQVLSDVDWRIEAYYPGISEARDSLVTKGMKGSLLTYRKKKMHRLAKGLEDEVFAPKASKETCRRCPFSIVCPGVGDGDEAASEEAP